MGTTPSVLTSVETDLNSIWSNTLGVLWSAATGTVDPWTKANIVTDAQTGITQALGPNPDPAAVAEAQTSQASTITGFLTSIGADPSQAGAGLANSLNPANIFSSLGNLLTGGSSTTLILILLAGLAAIFVYAYGSSR
jgi:hypothetical protein